VHASAPEDFLDHGGRIGVLTGKHPITGRNQDDFAAETEIGIGKLRARHPRTDHNQTLGDLGECVKLLPGEDSLAVGQG